MDSLAPNAIQPRPHPPTVKSPALWTAVLGAPVLWLTHLQLSYMLVLHACHTGKYWPLHATSLVLLLLTLGGGVIAYREFRSAGALLPDTTTEPLTGRTRLLGALGILSSALFSLAILAQALPTFILDPCAT